MERRLHRRGGLVPGDLHPDELRNQILCDLRGHGVELLHCTGGSLTDAFFGSHGLDRYLLVGRLDTSLGIAPGLLPGRLRDTHRLQTALIDASAIGRFRLARSRPSTL